MLQHRYWAQYQPHPDGASTSILHFMFFPLTSARPPHFPLPSSHPPRYPMAEARTCNTVPWTQLLKQNTPNGLCISHMGLQQAPCAHAHTQTLTDSQTALAVHICAQEKIKGIKDMCYLSFSSDSASGRAPASPSTFQSQSCRQNSHTISAQSTTALTGHFSFFFFFKNGKTSWVGLPALHVSWSAKHFTWAMNHQQWQQQKHLVIMKKLQIKYPTK